MHTTRTNGRSTPVSSVRGVVTNLYKEIHEKRNERMNASLEMTHPKWNLELAPHKTRTQLTLVKTIVLAERIHVDNKRRS